MVKSGFLAVGLMALGGTLQAQDAAPAPRPNIDAALRAEPGAVAQVMAAQDLYALSLSQNDALAALAAGRIMSGVTLSALPRRPVSGSAPDGPSAPQMPGAAAMFDRAKRLTLDEGLAALIESERAASTAAPQLIVGASEGSVPAQSQDTWDLAFYAGSLAEIAVIGPGTAVLQITVQDAQGRMICQQAGPRDRLYCPFVPQENGQFSVIVGNLAAQSTGYRLLTN